MGVMTRFHKYLALAALAMGMVLAPGSAVNSSLQAANRIMPEFTHQTPDAWLNSAPLKASSFRGKVVLLEVYASG